MGRRGRRVGFVIGVVVLGVLPVAVPTASVAASTSGDWYYDTLGVGDAHAEGWTGKGITIGVIDEQINPDVPTLEGVDLRVHEPSFCKGGTATSSEEPLAEHTTTIAAYIAGNGKGYDGAPGIRGVAPGATVRVYVTSTGEKDGSLVCDSKSKYGETYPPAEALTAAVRDGCDIVSISRDVAGNDQFENALVDAVRHGVIVIAAGANGAQEAGLPTYPVWYNGVLGVGAMDSDLKLAVDGGKTVVNPFVDVVAPGVLLNTLGSRGDWTRTGLVTGTSLATPITASVLAMVMQKYPKATSNQILQSTIRNTGRDDHPLEFDSDGGYGYGLLSLRHLLRVDPTQYPDENPLIVGGNAVPSESDFAAAPTAAPTARDDRSSFDKVAAESVSRGPDILPFLIGGGVLVLGVAAVGAVLVGRRRATRR